MGKTKVPAAMAFVFMSAALFSGCQKAPEPVAEGGVMHAQGAVEQQVSELAGQASETGQSRQPGGSYHYEEVLGTGDNRLSINARIPAVPEQLYNITLEPDDGIGKAALLAFLGGSEDRVTDASQEYLRQIEESDYNNTHDTGDGIVLYSKFADHSAMMYVAGERSIALGGHTSLYYEDAPLKEKLFAGIGEEIPIPPDQMDNEADFTAREAGELLLEELKRFGVTEAVFYQIYFGDSKEEGLDFYELSFVPAYEGVADIRETVNSELGEIYPYGRAIVSQEGIADLILADFCGKIVSKEPVEILSFAQVSQILEQYLDGGRIPADERLVIDRVELEYYPLPNEDVTYEKREIEYRFQLQLVPVWHLYMSLHDYVEGGYAAVDNQAAFNIVINAATGELERVR